MPSSSRLVGLKDLFVKENLLDGVANFSIESLEVKLFYQL